MMRFLARSNPCNVVNKELVKQIEKEVQHWEEVLKRVVAVINFLAQRGLPFEGETQLLGEPHNGNFLGCMELIAEFDPFLKEYLTKCANQGKGHVSYLSQTTVYNELIHVMGSEVLKKILTEIKKS